MTKFVGTKGQRYFRKLVRLFTLNQKLNWFLELKEERVPLKFKKNRRLLKAGYLKQKSTWPNRGFLDFFLRPLCVCVMHV